MEFKVTGSIRQLVNRSRSHNSYDQDDFILYKDLKGLWLEHLDISPDDLVADTFYDLTKSSSLCYGSLYPAQKEKTPEEMARYKSRLQELEYKQLTKGMAENQQDHFQVTIKGLNSRCD